MKYTTTQKKSEKAQQTSVANINTQTKTNDGFSLEDNRSTTVIQQQKINKIQDTNAQPLQLKKKSMRARIRKKISNNTPLTAREKEKAIAFGMSHEYTHRNIPNTTPARRGSIAEANTLDTINPAGAAVPHTGLNLADFRARFQPLAQGGNISTGRLNALLPHHKAVPFPPARGGGGDEIRAGRKWEIPNPDGGTHSIWVHTNDPRQNPPENAGAGPIVRVQDSSGKYLSEQHLNAPQQLLDQRAARIRKGKAPLPNVETAIANKTGHWTTPDDGRANHQHIPLV